MNEARKKKILLVEDEPHLAFSLAFNLQAEGYEVIPAANGQIALEKLETDKPFDLIVLDVMLPEVNGLEIARRIRRHDNRTGILMLTAQAAESDIIKGLEAGADDYMTKPFHLKEFLLRVKRMAARSELLKPSGEIAPKILNFDGFTLDLEALKLSGPLGQFNLTELEANLLNEFLSNPSKILSRQYLLKKVWGLHASVETRTVDNFIMRLRKYIEKDPSHPAYLESVRGRGYRFNGKTTPEK